MPRQRLTDWLGSKSSDSNALPKINDLRMLLAGLRAGSPGQWSQNLLELSRHFTSATYLAVNTMASQAGISNFEINERTHQPDMPNGKVTLPDDDPIHELFESPNEQDTWHDLLYQTVQQEGLTGLCLTWHPKLESGDIAEIYNIPSATAWPMPPTNKMPYGAYRVVPYILGMYGPSSAQVNAGAIVPAEQIVRVKKHHPLFRWDGYATLTACSMQVDTLEAIDKGRFNVQQLGCDQSIAIEMTPDTSIPDPAEIDRLRSQLQALYAGPANVGKIFIPPPGGKISKISTSPSEMGYQEGWSQILDFVLATYGVPRAVAGMQNEMSYATLFSSLKAFFIMSLGPVLRRITQGWNKKLVKPTWGKQFSLNILPPEFKDETIEELKFSNDIKCGVMTIAERRRYRGLDHIDEPWTKERAMMTRLSGDITGEGSGGSERGGERDGQANDTNVDNARPKKSYDMGMRTDILEALERGKTNGTLHPVKT